MNVPQEKIHVETFGAGPSLVMLHGWAMHSRVWGGFAQKLSKSYRVTLVDLPGYGMSCGLGDIDIVDAVLSVVPETAHWLGWSLGALVAIKVAERAPHRILSLISVAGTPKFIGNDAWPGLSQPMVLAMSENLEKDFIGTIRRFIALQTFGMQDARKIAKMIEELVLSLPLPDERALKKGLDLILGCDLRKQFSGLNVPVLIIQGTHDRLIPIELPRFLRQLNSVAEISIIDGAVHIPFLTHEQQCLERVDLFLSEIDARLKEEFLYGSTPDV